MFALAPGVESRHPRRHDGFSLIELLLVIAIIAIIAAIAVPGMLRARVAANEGSAIASMRTISSAQSAYASSCGGGYAQSLADLGRPPAGSAPFLPPDITTGEKAGYAFAVHGAGDPVSDAGDTCNNAAQGTMSAFLAIGNPVSDGQSGVRGFGVNSGGVLRWTAAAAGITDAASYAAASVTE
jgi:type IV pilus assembly protein PilA